MCGIAGFIGGGAAAQRNSIARAMASALRHRGPDDEGIWQDEFVTLAHRRLAIVDLSPSGAQPMQSASGRFVISFNGEIYNHAELRAKLELRGAAFRGTSDTEVLLALIEASGARVALDDLVGMFAFALWDRKERRLTLVRDRLGEKPLYYGWQGNSFLFGSELKALRAHPNFEATVDPNALGMLMRWAYVPAPHSIYAGIEKLRAGELLHLHLPRDGKPVPARCQIEKECYWHPDDVVARGLQNQFHGSIVEGINELARHIGEAVRLQLRADVPVGAFLSGGIDSSLIVAVMQSQISQPVRTFSIGFADRAFDEAVHARAVARHLGTLHTERQITPADALAVIPALPSMFDEPFGDASQIPTFLVAKLAREHVTVSLSGDGGDELFGGYRKYAMGTRLAEIPLRSALGSFLSGWPMRAVVQVLSRVPRFHSLSAKRLPALARMLSADRLYLAQLLSEQWRDVEQLVPGVLHSATNPQLNAIASAVLFTDLDYGDIATAVDQHGYLPDDVLTKVDRSTMAVSLESRAPLLDHRVVEFAGRLPWAWRGGKGNEKRILRQLLYRYVPQTLVDRPKMGFSVPIAAWLRNDLRTWADDLLASEKLRRDGFFNASTVQMIWHEHRSGAADRSNVLWSILMFQSWLAHLSSAPSPP